MKRRPAIVVDGVIESAPVIQAEIPDGVVMISMHTGSLDDRRNDAERLARKLMGR